MIQGCGILALAGQLTVGMAFGAEEPKYGGSLEVISVTPGVSALSWDNYDWIWKHNQDSGQVYEQLFAADLSKARSRGGKFAFTSDAFLPSEAIRGELAESWQWFENPLRVEIKLRKGVMFPEKAGVMKARELVADDIIYAYKRVSTSPKMTPGYFDFVSAMKATDSHTVVFEMKEYNAEWDYRFGYGYNSGIIPREVVEAGANNWKNVNGTGPFRLTDVTSGNAQTYEKNKDYWDSETINGKQFKLPYTDKMTYRFIKDEATRFVALRTGKVDIIETMRWQDADQLRKQVPQLKWHRWLNTSGTLLSLRVDQKPFDDIRVRRALNLAVNKKEIIEAYYNGNAELFAYPQSPEYEGYYQPLSEQPASVKELFEYNPEKAKKLLAEAGYAKGFAFKVQVGTHQADHGDLLTLVAGYLEQVGVKVEIQPMEMASFLSVMTNRTNGPGYFMNNGHTNPTTTIRKSFMTGQTWNPSNWSDPKLDARIEEIHRERDEGKRQAALKELTTEMVDKAPYIWLPTPYAYTAWWPWVKGYEGELRAGAVRPGPIYARIWIDQDLKKKMGF